MKDDVLIDKTDKTIAELVYDKVDLKKAYNYYNGKRDAELFRYLEENYGIGSPTAVEFTPLIKKHVDALVGEFLGTPIYPKISCKDSETINNIYRDKLLEIEALLSNFLKRHLRNSVLQFMDNRDITDKSIEQQLNKIIEDVELNFVSLYEQAALNVVEYVMQSRLTDIFTKLRTLLLDLLITGWTFFRGHPSAGNNNVEILVFSPLNTFIEKNPESPYVKDSPRCVIRTWMNRLLIISKYGKDLSSEDLKKIKDEWQDNEYSSYYVRTINNVGVPRTPGIRAGEEVVPGYPLDHYDYNLFPVYEVEWIETDSDFVMLRYLTIRIGDGIYILKGKDENVIRSKDNPNYCSLTLNGVYFMNRDYEPYSLVKACEHLLDKLDLLLYYRDNLIANSGTAGDWIDESLIPTNLGVTWPERLQKWLAYKKQGTALLDTSQEGRLAAGLAPINTIFNGFDDTVKALAILAILLAIDSVEQTMSSITGVFRERLNGIELHDAVTNIKLGITNSFTITKPIYLLMDLVTAELLLDALNTAKIVYKNGLTGTLILGEKYLKIFTALPEHFTMSDFDIHVLTSTLVMQEMLLILSVIPNFILSGAFSPEIIFEAITAKSLSELKFKVSKALAKLKAENNLLQLLLQQVELLQQLLLELLKLNLQANSKIELLNEQKMQLEREKFKSENEVNWYKARTDRDFKTAEAKNDELRTKIEMAQLYDGNPYNDTVRQLGT